MNRHVYNGSLVVGWLLISAGVGMWSLPAGLIAAGALLIALTIASAVFASRSAG